MGVTLNSKRELIEEKQLVVLSNFNRELGIQMFDEHDPLDELLSMDLNEVEELVRDAYEYYIEEEGWKLDVAKVKALEEVALWYYGDKEREISLRERINDL